MSQDRGNGPALPNAAQKPSKVEIARVHWIYEDGVLTCHFGGVV